MSLAIACGGSPEKQEKQQAAAPSLLIGRWSNGITDQAFVDPALGATQPYGD